ncbi:MAG TPA: lamin tail domain-containing protein [Puia sp.]|nr:lamin tail domain-containing protein [Puia sp.]
MINLRLSAIAVLFAYTCIPLFGQTPAPYNVVIDEIFPDPSPAVGLPGAEFIELKNVSSVAYDLHNWRISNGSSTTTIKSTYFLEPDSFVVICSASASTDYSAFGPAIGISGFPSLDNTGGIIYLQSPEGITIHAVAYNKSWYQNDVKSSGGWSLEMKDTRNPCSGYNNWSSSIDPAGGTPGKKNSVDGINKDEQSPVLLRTYTIDSTTVIAVFDEPVDSLHASSTDNYLFDNNIGTPLSASGRPPLFNEVELKLPDQLQYGELYQLTVNNVTDCAGNTIGAENIAKAGMPVAPQRSDIIINEILFNPIPNGYDYVEFYNRSDKIIDCKQLWAAARNITGGLNDLSRLSSLPLLFFPGEYYVITENALWLNQNYQVKNPKKIIELSSIPSLPDDHGDIVLLDQAGNIIDEVQYDHKWHFALVNNEEGVALERIDYNKPSQDPANWTSAASTAGFGTPTYQNSELASNTQSGREITISPEIFSPDNDGFEDFCFINYQVPEPGYVGNITIFDAAGRPVRYLANNVILGLNGNFRWDGLDDNQKKLPIGIYVVMTEIFNLRGDTKKFKQAVVLGGRLN